MLRIRNGSSPTTVRLIVLGLRVYEDRLTLLRIDSGHGEGEGHLGVPKLLSQIRVQSDRGSRRFTVVKQGHLTVDEIITLARFKPEGALSLL